MVTWFLLIIRIQPGRGVLEDVSRGRAERERKREREEEEEEVLLTAYNN